MQLIDAVWAYAGQFGITLVVAVGAAWAAFRYLGDKWITNKFSASLEAFKHAHQQELERLKLQINTKFDRTVKLHGNEFEVLPEIWSKLNTSYNSTRALSSPGQQMVLLDQMSEGQLDYFLSQQDIPEYQKDGLKTNPDKNNAFFEISFWNRHFAAAEDARALTSYLHVKGIFLGQEIRSKIKEMEDILWGVIDEQEWEKRHPNPREGRFEKRDLLFKEGGAKMLAIEEAIRSRLWSDAAVTTDLS
ncbi:hypothetical protein Sj15T_00670 [Sphingobium sp. TA15]|uniref:Uncharacterized protein n=2 Tax=Sphingobium indicum TaxID=332055 RepID=D4YZD6_SPHIU|nr:hypothetical protein [Sphingobium indicum]EPR16128.1 hypothetical protein M527_22400 [Sphingobium indicum IP26]KER35171.1 hypothetical protein AL00_17595 [Sphingobium indicum F2]BAI95718.1 hypothetical protein SJA_C1-08840 [Sphingobium indicum UT26S]BDD65046.1 hypothetical protein Sj15T_00670 [Sphingobium sp. TA15]